NLDDIIKHTEHFLELGGENTLAIGSDFDGCDVPDEICGIEYIEKLYEYFLKKNYNQRVVDKIFFGNAYNFMIDNLK
ncbi:MAG: membrane dipeptidase, partial [Clostridia bacterium]|nr:membrane dipeptidase [Clostridia bacterium]MBR2734930.1 membrane dipeptidase [Clostridia bacterium]